MDFRVWALLSALFAGAVAVLSKKGVENVPTSLALAIRVFFILIIAIGMAAFGKEFDFQKIDQKAWWLLGGSAIATGGSWFCYFKALQGGPVSQVAPIDKLSFVVAVGLGALFLGEQVSWKLGIGILLIVAGVAVTLS
jgi:transporter family protein